MPAANINREFHFGELTPQSLRDNDKAIVAALAEIYSNKNLGLNSRVFTTTATMDVTDVVALCDVTGGAYTLTLPAANGGSSRNVYKSKLVMVCNTGGGTGSITVAAGSGDSISAGSLTVKPGSQYILYSDGVSIWYSTPRYETGTWTPTDQSGAGLALTVTKAKHIRNGGEFTIFLDVTYPVTASGAGASIGGVPYTEADHATGALWYGGAGGGTVGLLAGTLITFHTPGGAQLTNVQLSGARIMISITGMV